MDCNDATVIRLAETESTNRYLQQHAGSVADGTVVVADYQTAGRGQQGHAWESEAGCNLTFSLLYCPDRLPVSQHFAIAELAALSVKEAVDEYTDGICLKWPNDVYYGERKICGILIENELAGGFVGRSIIGIGLNVNQQQFRSDAPNPVSLRQITGCEHDRFELLARLRNAFSRLRRQLETDGPEPLHRRYVAALYRRDGYHRYRDSGGTFDARIADVALTGHLTLVRRDGTPSVYAFKEVEFLAPSPSVGTLQR